MTPVEMDLFLNGSIKRNRDVLLIHEAALVAFGLDYNVSPYGLDVLVGSAALKPIMLEAGAGASQHVWGLDRFVCLERGDMPVRLWGTLNGHEPDVWRSVYNGDYDRYCLAPDDVVRTLPLSPDAPLLLEERARLAEVLWYDKMTNEELSTFCQYVRGI